MTRSLVVATLAFALSVPALAADRVTASGVACEQPELQCPAAGCPVEVVGHPGNAVEPTTGRSYFLDYPCDHQAGDAVTFLLNIHGTAAPANWQRHYFPAKDFVDQHRLIVVHPQGRPHERDGSTATAWPIDGTDEEYIKALVDFVDESFGDLVDIHRFWVVGHSNGGRSADSWRRKSTSVSFTASGSRS